MRHPFWILNSAITALLILTFLFIAFSRQHIPYREPIEIEVVPAERVKQNELRINISKIYENDIFDTYQKEFPKAIAPIKEITLPPPPLLTTPKAPAIPKVEFLDPLNITLKGIVIVVSNDNDKHRAIIQDNATKNEMTYKVGNMIEDAQLIRIFNNKVIFLRSNGQQEVLYLREKDAELDPNYTILNGWSDVVQRIDNEHYLINPTTFLARIQDLAQFIDILDVTTAYQKGQSIGCLIGTVNNNSLGAALGLKTGDIIVDIDNIPAADTQQRFTIYKNIIAKKSNESTHVHILRNQQALTLVYTLEDFSILDKLEKISPAKNLELEEKMKEKQLKALHEKSSLVPPVQDLKKRERQNMLSKGKVPTSYNKSEEKLSK